MISKSHSYSSKKDRKAKKSPASNGMPTLTDKYNATDALVERCYCDIANGVSRSTIIEKIQQGMYGNKPVKARQSAYIYNAALDRFAVDCDVEAERLRNLFWGRYESIYEDCVKNNDRYNARCTLDSMAKIFLGLNDRNKATIDIQNNNGDIKITFGFNNDNENIEDQEVEMIDE